ncbi:MAG: DMT family transporter [Myxococcales bacterium]
MHRDRFSVVPSGHPSPLSYGLVALAAASWGTWPLILRAAQRDAPMPAALQSGLVLAVQLVVTGIAMGRDRVPVHASRRAWLAIAWIGVSDALNCVLFFAAYQRTTVAIAVLTHYLAPLFVAVVAPLVLSERARPRSWLAVGVGLAGLLLLLGPWSARLGANDLTGALFGAASAGFYASNILVSKRIAGVFSASELLFFHNVVAVPLLLLAVPHETWGSLNARGVGIVLCGALGPGALAGLIFVGGLRKLPASHASTLTLLEPLVAVVLGAAVLGETLGATGVFGGVLILVGAWLVVASRR